MAIRFLKLVVVSADTCWQWRLKYRQSGRGLLVWFERSQMPPRTAHWHCRPRWLCSSLYPYPSQPLPFLLVNSNDTLALPTNGSSQCQANPTAALELLKTIPGLGPCPGSWFELPGHPASSGPILSPPRALWTGPECCSLFLPSVYLFCHPNPVCLRTSVYVFFPPVRDLTGMNVKSALFNNSITPVEWGRLVLTRVYIEPLSQLP